MGGICYPCEEQIFSVICPALVISKGACMSDFFFFQFLTSLAELKHAGCCASWRSFLLTFLSLCCVRVWRLHGIVGEALPRRRVCFTSPPNASRLEPVSERVFSAAMTSVSATRRQTLRC